MTWKTKGLDFGLRIAKRVLRSLTVTVVVGDHGANSLTRCSEWCGGDDDRCTAALI